MPRIPLAPDLHDRSDLRALAGPSLDIALLRMEELEAAVRLSIETIAGGNSHTGMTQWLQNVLDDPRGNAARLALLQLGGHAPSTHPHQTLPLTRSATRSLTRAAEPIGHDIQPAAHQPRKGNLHYG